MTVIRSNTIEMVSIDSLVPHPKNMHKHSDEQIERLCKLIEYQGFRVPVIVQKGTSLIVAGHGRVLAARKLGIKEVPVIYQEFESDAQLYAFIVSDNAIGKDTWATLDLSAINTEMLDLGPDFDIDLLGLKDFNICPSESELPDLGDGSDPDIQQMTFTISSEQADIISEALSRVKKEHDCHDEINENSNGNAIAQICRLYVGKIS